MKKNPIPPNDKSTSFSNYKSHFLNSVKTHCGQVPYILWYPIASIISLLYALVHTIYHKISDTFRRPVLDQNRLTQLTRKAVRSVLRSSGSMVSVSGNQMVCRVFTALLQLLSAITTYAGFSYYLSPINPIAPLLLAVVVQGLCFYLLNYTAARKRTGGSLRAFLLAVVLLISSFTSFIGISNVVQSPVDDMKNQYATYRQAHNGMLDALIGKPEIDEGSIRQLLTKGKNLLSQAQKTASSRKSIRGTMNPNQVTETVNPDGTRTTSRSQDANILNQIGQQSGKIDELDNKIAAMKTALAPLETLGFDVAAKKISAFYDEVYTEDSAKTTLPPSKEYLDYIACLNAANDLQNSLNTLGSVKGSADPFAVSRYTIPLEQISAWNGLRLLPFEEIRSKAVSTSGTSANKNLFVRLNDYIIPPDISGAQVIHDKLKQEMDDKFHELYPTLSARDAAQANTLKSQYENSALESPQILPLTYLFSGKGTHSRGLSLFSLGLAVLTDLLSLLMSLALVKRRDSILYASNHAGASRNREELLEDCYTYICLRGLLGQTQKSRRMHTRKSVETYVCRNVEELMHTFFEKIRQEHLPPKLGSYGFIDEATFEALSTDEKDLFQTLQNIHMIHPVAQFEILELLRDEFEDGAKVKEGEPRPTAPLEERYRALFPADEITYLVDKKFLIWYNETFSELLGGGAVDYELLESTITKEPGSKETPAKEEL